MSTNQQVLFLIMGPNRADRQALSDAIRLGNLRSEAPIASKVRAAMEARRGFLKSTLIVEDVRPEELEDLGKAAKEHGYRSILCAVAPAPSTPAEVLGAMSAYPVGLALGASQAIGGGQVKIESKDKDGRVVHAAVFLCGDPDENADALARLDGRDDADQAIRRVASALDDVDLDALSAQAEAQAKAERDAGIKVDVVDPAADPLPTGTEDLESVQTSFVERLAQARLVKWGAVFNEPVRGPLKFTLGPATSRNAVEAVLDGRPFARIVALLPDASAPKSARDRCDLFRVIGFHGGPDVLVKTAHDAVALVAGAAMGSFDTGSVVAWSVAVQSFQDRLTVPARPLDDRDPIGWRDMTGPGAGLRADPEAELDRVVDAAIDGDTEPLDDLLAAKLANVQAVPHEPTHEELEAMAACPHAEPLHDHADGCPSCDGPDAFTPPNGDLGAMNSRNDARWAAAADLSRTKHGTEENAAALQRVTDLGPLEFSDPDDDAGRTVQEPQGPEDLQDGPF